MNLKQLTYKLQAALNQRGEHYKVNQLQHYSERLGRMVTKYVLEKAETDETGKHISTRVLETYSMADVVKTLAKIYRIGQCDRGGAPGGILGENRQIHRSGKPDKT